MFPCYGQLYSRSGSVPPLAGCLLLAEAVSGCPEWKPLSAASGKKLLVTGQPKKTCRPAQFYSTIQFKNAKGVAGDFGHSCHSLTCYISGEIGLVSCCLVGGNTMQAGTQIKGLNFWMPCQWRATSWCASWKCGTGKRSI